jgi:chromosome partitioning protein
MVLIVGSTKGGVGKTTIAFNFTVALSLAGRDVLLVDADTQATAMTNTQLRTERLGAAGFTSVALYGQAIIMQTPRLAAKYADVIIDVGGRDNPSLRSALLLPNATLLIPVKPRSYDLWGAEDSAALVLEARARGNLTLRAITVLNEADHLQEGDNAGAAAELRDLEGVEHAPMRLVRRKAYPNASAMGLSVVEYTDAKASEELSNLLAFVHPKYKAGVHSDGSRKKA